MVFSRKSLLPPEAAPGQSDDPDGRPRDRHHPGGSRSLGWRGDTLFTISNPASTAATVHVWHHSSRWRP